MWTYKQFNFNLMSHTFVLTEELTFMDGFADSFSLIDDQRREKLELEKAKEEELRALEERHREEREERSRVAEEERRSLAEKQAKARMKFGEKMAA